MVTASWNQFVTRSLHFVRSAKQSSGAAAAAAGENGAEASGASKTFFLFFFQNGGRQAVGNRTATSCTAAVRPLVSENCHRVSVCVCACKASGLYCKCP